MQTIVIKYGGNAMTSAALKKAVVSDVASLHKAGHRVVLAHGGGPDIEALLGALSIESRFVRGHRYTDSRAMEAVQMALCGKVNKDLTALLVRQEVDALGLCGLDAGLFRARRFDAELGLVGRITGVNKALLQKLLDMRLLPVVASVALNADNSADAEGASLNVNADAVACAIAAALGADALVMLTDTAGVLRDVNDPKTLIERIKLSDIPELQEAGVLSGGMIPKVEGAAEAVRQGVKSVMIIDGRVPHALSTALDGNRPVGTVIKE
jgi:acetylglutamate kinase